MIRFSCPLCGQVLKATEAKAGRAVACPRCDERSLVPGGGHPLSNASPGPLGQTPSCGSSSPPGGAARWVIALLAAAAGLGLLLAGRHPFLAVLGGVSFLLLGGVLHGMTTGCPSCRRWWTRTRVGRELTNREMFDRRGAHFARSLYRTNYACTECGHRWSVEEAEEYPARPPGDLVRARR